MAPQDIFVHVVPQDIFIHVAPQDKASLDTFIHVAPRDTFLHLAPQDKDIFIPVASQDTLIHVALEDIFIHAEGHYAQAIRTYGTLRHIHVAPQDRVINVVFQDT